MSATCCGLVGANLPSLKACTHPRIWPARVGSNLRWVHPDGDSAARGFWVILPFSKSHLLPHAVPQTVNQGLRVNLEATWRTIHDRYELILLEKQQDISVEADALRSKQVSLS